MSDDRIQQYLAATQAMASGEFGVVLVGQEADDLGRLGNALTQLAANLRRRFDELSKLRELSERINAGLFLDEVLDHVFVSFQDLIPFDRIGFALIDDSGTEARSVWARSRRERLAIEAGYSAPLENSSLKTILDTGRPRVIEDLEAYFAEHPSSAPTQRIMSEGVRSSLTCPLIALGHPVGFLFFSSFAKGTYVESHAEMFQSIAGQLSLVIEKGRLYEDLLRTKNQLEAANRELQRLATLDGLTGISNRRGFDERLDMEWRRAAREGQDLGLLLLDVDHFKRFNDTMGHLAGDECLRAIAGALGASLRRAHDFVARYGGEEFGVILAHSDLGASHRTAERLRSAVAQIAQAHPDSPVGPYVTISVGVASQVPGRERSAEGLLAAADAALYRAKAQGRNQVVAAGGPQGGLPYSSMPPEMGQS